MKTARTPLQLLRSPRRIAISEIGSVLNDTPFIRTNKKEEIADAVFTFDIETSSFYEEGEKRNCMYAFVFFIRDFNHYIIGRTWEEFLDILENISLSLHLDGQRKALVYVHNLAYEFQYISRLLEWKKIFALDKREPVQCLSDRGIEFRCSYKLSGYSLEVLGRNLHRYQCRKMTGDLDYSKVRHSTTPMTATEQGYLINDGRVVSCYIQELIDDLGNITKIPLTKTGFVRNYCRRQCLPKSKKRRREYYQYSQLMKVCTISSVQEYQQLKRGFAGGFTHGNALYTGLVIDDVTSLDFTSSYPSVMCCEQFPMSKGRLVTPHSYKEFLRYLNTYCCLFDITIYDLEPKTDIDNPLSFSKCWEHEGVVTDNGRIVSARKVTTTLTELDYDIFTHYYKWKKITVMNMRVYAKNYLPKPFVSAILKLYGDKTTLKGVAGKEKEYQNSKEQVNACFGMTVTDICRDEIEYSNGEWSSSHCDIQKALNQNNRSRKRFLYYPWGVWVTAYARRNLLMSLLETWNEKTQYSDYLYSDTDSMKIRHYEDHKEFVERYNRMIDEKMKKAMRYQGLDYSLTRPKTIKGEEKPLGHFDFDGHYTRFKYLGAKRYMVEYDDKKVSLTVSGLNKDKTIPYLLERARIERKDVFELFDDELYVPAEHTGKNTHTYIDYETEGDITDYMGNPGHYHELSSVHLEGADYSLSLADAYINYIMGLREVRTNED